MCSPDRAAASTPSWAIHKQEALHRQKQYFTASVRHEREWLDYNAYFKAFSNWLSYAGYPFGDRVMIDPDGRRKHDFDLGPGTQRSFEVSDRLHARWGARREGHTGYGDSRHPFRNHGSADINLYKAFMESAYALLRDGGRLGLICPSGLYSDQGSRALRELLLRRCRWEWLFGFENRDGIFGIHRSFKFNAIIATKGPGPNGEGTRALRASFMNHDLENWSCGPQGTPGRAEKSSALYRRDQIEQFSPDSKAVLEIRSKRDLQVLERIYGNAVPLGDRGPDGWGITYVREFDMTNDSKLFPPRPRWEGRGYEPDEYCRWLRGRWRSRRRGGAAPPHCRRADMAAGVILSRDATKWIHEDDVEDAALPLYEGRLFGAFDFAAKNWVSGSGLQAVWREPSGECREINAQYLMSQGDAVARVPNCLGPKVAYRNIARNTDTRTVIATVLMNDPTPHVTSNLVTADPTAVWALASVLNSWVFDYVARARLAGVHLDCHVIEQFPLPRARVPQVIGRLALQLANAHIRYSMAWLMLCGARDVSVAWRAQWAVTCHERLRLRCMLDAIIAGLYGLDDGDLIWILRDCDWPVEKLSERSLTRRLDPKGFWRVDRQTDPELRHPVLTLAASRDLKAAVAACGGEREAAIEVFCSQNGDAGWMLPETLCLADLGLGRDERARRPQPVSERLGPRFYRWQLNQDPEESWRECALHARNVLGEEGLRSVLRNKAVSVPEPFGLLTGGSRKLPRPWKCDARGR
ncbi:MAG: Eco57I restriction-modification methylase domain-containing protein [Planctomycetota bacterium]